MLFDGQMHSNSVKQPKLTIPPPSDLYRPASIFPGPPSSFAHHRQPENSPYQVFKKIFLPCYTFPPPSSSPGHLPGIVVCGEQRFESSNRLIKSQLNLALKETVDRGLKLSDQVIREISIKETSMCRRVKEEWREVKIEGVA